MTFDRVIAVDWSARAKPSPAAPTKDAIFVSDQTRGAAAQITYHRTRQAAMAHITSALHDAVAADQRTFVGFDFAFGYPASFAQKLTGTASAFAVWDWFSAQVKDGPNNANKRFDVAAAVNRSFPGVGPYWGCPTSVASVDLPEKGSVRHGHGMAEKRSVEQVLPQAQPVWKLYTTGSVGSQTLMGLPHLNALRHTFGDALQVWPFDTGWATPTAQITLAEIYPSLIAPLKIPSNPPAEMADILDAHQVSQVCTWVLGMGNADLANAFQPAQANHIAQLEGWIFGAGLIQPKTLAPPPLTNDCFALPPGTDWTPVETALELLQARLHAVTQTQILLLAQAAGRVLAQDIIAARAHPPAANSAVDGFGFAGPVPDGPHTLPLLTGRAAAGQPYLETVPAGHAIRILTGATLPAGVDTIVLEEDTRFDATHVAFHGPLRAGANARKAGEDMTKGAITFAAGRRLTPADLALLAATGADKISVHQPLRVAVLSTGDELVEAGKPLLNGQISDANRPMLLAMITKWGLIPVDLGIIRDDPNALRAALTKGAATADVILTSGGASAGDEDHVSALLQDTGSMALWRLALKPGRPMALAIWDGTPVFGLPGNPVAAFVCTLIFARPAFDLLGGASWATAQGFTLPAAFSKRKKPGRREYLRARIRNAQVEVFASEGSGRISGLSWAEGLVELDDTARDIQPGDPVHYIPFTSFDL